MLGGSGDDPGGYGRTPHLEAELKRNRDAAERFEAGSDTAKARRVAGALTLQNVFRGVQIRDSSTPQEIVEVDTPLGNGTTVAVPPERLDYFNPHYTQQGRPDLHLLHRGQRTTRRADFFQSFEVDAQGRYRAQPTHNSPWFYPTWEPQRHLIARDEDDGDIFSQLGFRRVYNSDPNRRGRWPRRDAPPGYQPPP